MLLLQSKNNISDWTETALQADFMKTLQQSVGNVVFIKQKQHFRLD